MIRLEFAVTCYVPQVSAGIVLKKLVAAISDSTFREVGFGRKLSSSRTNSPITARTAVSLNSESSALRGGRERSCGGTTNKESRCLSAKKFRACPGGAEAHDSSN